MLSKPAFECVLILELPLFAILRLEHVMFDCAIPIHRHVTKFVLYRSDSLADLLDLCDSLLCRDLNDRLLQVEYGLIPLVNLLLQLLSLLLLFGLLLSQLIAYLSLYL